MEGALWMGDMTTGERERDGIGANLSTRALAGYRSTDHQERLLACPKTPRRECIEMEGALWMGDMKTREREMV
jgi:hypothetical protein